MKLTNKILLVITTSIFLFFFANEISYYFIELKNVKEHLYQKNKTIYQTINNMQSDKIKLLASALANDAQIKKGYIQNDPEIIKEHVIDFWKQAKSEELIYEIHFFKPPAQSFVNFSNFNSIGKDVSDARSDIVWVTSSFKNSIHTMMCKTYAGLRATVPILNDNNEILGGLSMGKKIDWLPKSIKNLSKSDSFLVYDMSATHSLLKQYYNNFIKDKRIIGDYILADKTIPIEKNIITKIDFTKKIQDITINGKQYSLNIFKIVDFEKEDLAYLCILNDLDTFNSKFINRILTNLLLILIISFLSYLFIKAKTASILKQINYLQNITKEIKINNFSILNNIKPNGNVKFKDELAQLQTDIIDMGNSLQISYNNLEKQVADRTKDLEYEKNYIQKILNLTPDITLVTNGNRLLSANQRFYEFVEYETIDDFLKDHDCICDYFTYVNDQKFDNTTKRIDGKIWSIYIVQHPQKIHTAIINKDENLYYFNISAEYLDGDEVLVTLQDVTELKERDNLLYEQSKMASMGEMIGNIAHQWRQPLSVISTAATGMQMEKEFNSLTDEKFFESCELINGNAQYLSKTIDDFRNFIKGDRSFVKFNLKENIESFLNLIEASAKIYNIELILDLEENIELKGYPNELTQCFINIFNNSKDILKNKDGVKTVFITTRQMTDKIIIHFKDNGGGIDNDILPKVFDPYFTTKHQTQGTGLGLHMTYQLITDGMKGSINAQNTTFNHKGIDYKGAQFTIMLYDIPEK